MIGCCSFGITLIIILRLLLLLGVPPEELLPRQVGELRRAVRGCGGGRFSAVPPVSGVRARQIVVQNRLAPGLLFGRAVGLCKGLLVRGERGLKHGS